MVNDKIDYVVLLPIKPVYAEAIKAGRKKIEFRKRAFARQVKYVIIYASSPQKKVIGYFEIKTITEAHPKQIWKKYKKIGCISKLSYDHYFFNAERAVGIIINNFYLFASPLALEDLHPGLKAPQSYQYLKSSIIETIKNIPVIHSK